MLKQILMGVSIICISTLCLILVEVYWSMPTLKGDYAEVAVDLKAGMKSFKNGTDAWQKSSEKMLEVTEKNKNLAVALDDAPKQIHQILLNTKFFIKEGREALQLIKGSVDQLTPRLTETIQTTNDAVGALSKDLTKTTDAATGTLNATTKSITDIGDKSGTALVSLNEAFVSFNNTISDPNIKKSFENIEKSTYYGSQILEVTYKRMVAVKNFVFKWITLAFTNAWELLKSFN